MRVRFGHISAALLAAVLVLAIAVPTAGAAPQAAPSASPFPAPVQRQLTKALDSSFGKTVSPGAIVGIWVDGHGWTATRGTSRRGAKLKPSVEDRTRIGSLTKTFAATLILQLADEGKLKLSDPLSKWFPWVPNASQITIRELGDMSSGINSYTFDQSFLDRYFGDPEGAWKPIEVIKDGVSLPAKFAPGQGFFYSNTNFVLLGQIAEKVTGTPIGRLLRERIFAPLGMTHTTYPFTTAIAAPFLHGYTQQSADGTSTQVEDATHWNPTPFGAAGQIVSNLGDMRAFAEAVGTGSLLSKAGHRAQLTPNPFAVKGNRSYDFGVGVDNGWITHAGIVPGYNTDFGYLPKLKATIVVLTNTDIEPASGGAPAPAIMSALSGVIAAPDDQSTP
jgi:D-alanyl-D-alanine carboxypeptidase